MMNSFQRASEAPAPDLWDEVLRRASAGDDLSGTEGEDPVQPRPSRRMLLVTAAIAIAGVAAGMGTLAGGERSERVSSEGTTPTSAPDGSTSATAVPWYGDDNPDAIPDMIPVNICLGTTRSPDLGCVGYVDSRLIFPELQPPDAPINSQIDYQPGPSPVFEEDGDLYGYLIPDLVGVVPVAEFDPDVYGEPEHLPPR